MSGISLEYTLDMEQPMRAFDALATADRQILMTDIAEEILVETQTNFDLEQAPDGTPWEPSQRDGKTLQDKRHLYDSLTYIVESDGNSAEVGSNMEYAAIHQFGGKAGRNHSVELVARPYLGIAPELHERIGDMVINFHGDVLGGI